MLRKHYWEVVDRETAERYWAIRPLILKPGRKVTAQRRFRRAVTPTKVPEVRYDHFSGQRFRPGCAHLECAKTNFRRTEQLSPQPDSDLPIVLPNSAALSRKISFARSAFEHFTALKFVVWAFQSL
jgi:hypothetical protein